MRRGVLVAALVAIAVARAGGQQRGFAPLEVRQLVTFRWAEAVPFAVRPEMDTLAAIYRQTPAVVRMRAFHEALTPEPFDLIVMTSFRGLEGFELAHRQMADQRTPDGRTLAATQRRLVELSEWRREEFVEMLGDHDHRTGTDPRVLVFEWLRIVPGSHRAYELMLQTAVVPWERERTFVHLSETGRVLVGDGWDYLRILGFESLAGYHDYLDAWRERSEADQLALHVSVRKTIVVREDDRLRVR